jgi:hypothetical protein
MTVRHLPAEEIFRHIPFPASKKDVVRTAQRRGAPDTVVTGLLAADKPRFESVAEVRRVLLDSNVLDERRADR